MGIVFKLMAYLTILLCWRWIPRLSLTLRYSQPVSQLMRTWMSSAITTAGYLDGDSLKVIGLFIKNHVDVFGYDLMIVKR